MTRTRLAALMWWAEYRGAGPTSFAEHDTDGIVSNFHEWTTRAERTQWRFAASMHMLTAKQRAAGRKGT